MFSTLVVPLSVPDVRMLSLQPELPVFLPGFATLCPL